MNTRLERLRPQLRERELDALLVSTPENRRYLSGFTGSAGYLFITQKDAVLATDFRYIEQSDRQAPDYRVDRIGRDMSWLVNLAQETGAKRIGFESDHLTVAQYQRLTETLKEASEQDHLSLVATSGIVEELRSIKDAQELALLMKAVEIADQAFEEVAPTIRVGEPEKEVAWRLEQVMRKLGAEKVSFDTIVASGPNGALPHHRAGEDPISEGVPIVIDMGASYEGYCSDMTRTICLGTPDETFRKVYDIVLGAQETACATAQEGMTAGEVDALARNIIQEAGYGDQFGHALGHGIGLAVHEFPGVAPNAPATMVDDMVFTIEPGIYLPGWGGVRIEDTVVMEGGRVRRLSQAHKRERP